MGKLRERKKKVEGVGINDSDYKTQLYDVVEGKRKTVWICPYYATWKSLLVRCYSQNFKSKRPTYEGCTVCEEWLTFSNFKAWMEKQDWEGKHLDKDLTVEGNKIYSPETCVFVLPEINSFMTKAEASRGKYPIGVNAFKDVLVARCHTGSGRKFLGRYKDPIVAHRAWQVEKMKRALELSDMQTDPTVKAGLLRVYEKIKKDFSENIVTSRY